MLVKIQCKVKLFAIKDVCNRHMKNNVCNWKKDEQQETQPKKFNCELCGRGFDLRSDLKEHQRSPTGQANWCKKLRYIDKLPTNESNHGEASTAKQIDESTIANDEVITVTVTANENDSIQIEGPIVRSDTNVSHGVSKFTHAEETFPSQHDEAVWKPPGFVNPHTNSCYMNSVLQIMSSNDEFMKWLMNYYNGHDGYCYSKCEFNPRLLF